MRLAGLAERVRAEFLNSQWEIFDTQGKYVFYLYLHDYP